MTAAIIIPDVFANGIIAGFGAYWWVSSWYSAEIVMQERRVDCVDMLGCSDVFLLAGFFLKILSSREMEDVRGQVGDGGYGFFFVDVGFACHSREWRQENRH